MSPTPPTPAADWFEATAIRVLYGRTRPPKVLTALRDSIRADGVREPLLLSRRHVLINGHCRYQVGVELGLTRFRCAVDDALDTPEREVRAVCVADLQSNRSVEDTTGLIVAYMTAAGCTQAQAAERLGLSPALVSRYLSVLDFDDTVRGLLRDQRVTLKHLLAVKRLKDPARRAEWLRRAAANGWTATQMMKAATGGESTKRTRSETFAHQGFVLTYPAGSVRQVEAGLRALHAALRERLKAADKQDLPAAAVLGDEAGKGGSA